MIDIVDSCCWNNSDLPDPKLWLLVRSDLVQDAGDTVQDGLDTAQDLTDTKGEESAPPGSDPEIDNPDNHATNEEAPPVAKAPRVETVDNTDNNRGITDNVKQVFMWVLIDQTFRWMFKYMSNQLNLMMKCVPHLLLILPIIKL